MSFSFMCLLAVMSAALLMASAGAAPELRAGVGRVDITDREDGPVNDTSYVKALALRQGETTAVLITVDAVAIGEIGRIGNDYLSTVRAGLQREFGIPPSSVLINASHCHSVVRRDVAKLTVDAVRRAWSGLTPVRAGAGRSSEDRIQENRRLKLKDGSELDVRRAYSLPADSEVVSVGPIDPEIGLLRLDRLDGRPLAALYNFACHPIHGVPNGGNTADYPGFASQVIEENLGGDNSEVMAFFVQGCAGDINPAGYKHVQEPHDAEPLGHRLGLSALRGLRKIRTAPEAELRVVQETLKLPRAADYQHRIAALQTEQATLLKSLQATSINFKSFLVLYLQHRLDPEFPSESSFRYLHQKARGREDLKKLDAENRTLVDQYLRNIHAMEHLTRLQTNLALLELHQKQTAVAGTPELEVEVNGLRIGDFRLVTFPGEITVEIGLGLKKRLPGTHTFVAGYTNGYIYYTPTAAQRNNKGYAQEDCDCLVAPEWQERFEARAAAVAARL